MKTKLISLILLLIGMQGAYAQEYYGRATRFMVKNPQQIFIGAILNSTSLNSSTYQSVDAEYKPITQIYSFAAKAKEITPSRPAMIATIRESIQEAGTLKASYTFSYTIKELEKYDDLAFNVGQTLESPFHYGTPASRRTYKTLVAMDISQTFFSVGMDLPEELCSNPSELAGYAKNELVYVSSLEFGRRAIVLVESPFEYAQVKAATEYMLKKAEDATYPVNNRHEAVFANSSYRIVVVGDETIENANPDSPLDGLVKYLNRAVSAEDFGTPVAFSASYLKDNGVFENKYPIY